MGRKRDRVHCSQCGCYSYNPSSEDPCEQCSKYLEYENGEASPEEYEPKEGDWLIEPGEM